MATKAIKVNEGNGPAQITVHDPELKADRLWETRPLVRSVKKTLRELAEEQSAIIKTARVAAGLPEIPEDPDKPGDYELTDEQDEEVLQLMCGQITAATVPLGEGQSDLGDYLFAGWENDQVTDDEIIQTVQAVLVAAGKQSAS